MAVQSHAFKEYWIASYTQRPAGPAATVLLSDARGLAVADLTFFPQADLPSPAAVIDGTTISLRYPLFRFGEIYGLLRDFRSGVVYCDKEAGSGGLAVPGASGARHQRWIDGLTS